MKNNAILGVSAVGFQWATLDPFLFCVHHEDAYPAGNDQLGPAVSLAGRDIGQDFEGKDGFRMYHGDVVPGFPQHPHRGFETVTIVRRGLVDHSDSLGATARYGNGDVQWLTAGEGIVHSEMFPLIDQANPNPLELFQIWLNLPRASKLSKPHFSMFWRDALPRYSTRDAAGRSIDVEIVAGRLGSVTAPPPPPESWAARPNSDVAIWTIKLAPSAEWTLPPAMKGTNRALYFFRGNTLRIEERELSPKVMVQLRPEAEVTLVNGSAHSELLLLQGQPIGETVAQYGPFVMNSRAELQQAFLDYQRTQFGGWPWQSDGPVHPRSESRFAHYPDGRIERAK